MAMAFPYFFRMARFRPRLIFEEEGKSFVRGWCAC